jgi:peptidoglycan/LPS O-acetylase OafA/YrhL
MTPTWALRAYRQLVRLYPRRFREDYGPDLVVLVADQLRDEPAWRVWSRSVVDLALTVPIRHLEAHMDRSPTNLVPALFGAVALASVIVGVVVGHPTVLVACIAVGAAAGCLGLLAAHRARPLSEPRRTSAQWWKLTAAGAGLLAALIAVTTATGELPEGGWLLAMITGLTALLLLGAGLVLGIAHLASRPSRRATAG